MNQENGKTIQSVERALSIIQCIDQSANGLTLTELSEMLNLNVGTVRGLVMTLLNNGYLIKSEKNNRFFLGYEFLMKANRVSEGYVRYLRTWCVSIYGSHRGKASDEYLASDCSAQPDLYGRRRGTNPNVLYLQS